MIQIRRIFGRVFVSGTALELSHLQGLSGVELSDGDKLVKLPAHHHVHRNPRRKALLKYIEDKDEQENKEG